MRVLGVSALMAALMVIQGCGTSTPPCSDERTIGLVKKIFRKSLEDDLAAKGLELSLADQITNSIQLNVATIRTTGNDEQVHKFSCHAVLDAIVPEKTGKVVNRPSFLAAVANDFTTQGIEVSGNSIRHDVQYTSHVTDDGDQHLVEMSGHKPIIEVAIALASNGLLGGSRDEASASKPSSPLAKPATVPDLSKYLGQHPTEVFKDAVVMRGYMSLLGEGYGRFVESLSTAGELEMLDDFYFGSGCAPHVCSINEAAIAIHKTTGRVYAAQLIDGKELKTYGATPGNGLPGPLRDWYSEHGGPN